MAEPPEEPAEDSLLSGRVRLLQPAGGHRAGTDAVLLAALAAARPGDLVLDVGAGTGAVGLMVAARRPGVRLAFVERDEILAALCRRNLALNGREGLVAAADLFNRRACRAAGLAPEGADWVVTNPPFLESGQGRASPDAARADAHLLPRGGTERWLRACAAALRPRGTLALVHRADRLRTCLDGLGAGFGALTLRFVHPRADAPAHRLLLTAVKGSRGPLSVAPPLVLHADSGSFTPPAEAIHRGEASLA